jgi:glycosyltransferase involved in cell wall biosynthesis
MYYLGSGGAEKALINLLDMMDYNRYQVDLLLFEHKGLYLSQLNENVNLLPLIPEFEKVRRAKNYCKWAIMHGRFISAGKRVYYLMQEKKGLNTNRECWNLYLKRFLTPLPKEYDVAVGYLQGLSNWYVADKVKAKVKYGWIHTDYKKSNYDKTFDLPFFENFQHIVSISEECTDSLRKAFPTLSKRCLTLLNLMSPEIIRKRANYPNESFPDDHNVLRLLTIGRLLPVKGIDMAIKACSLLKKKNYSFLWYIIGDGDLKGTYIKMIEEYDVKDCFILLGEKENPYPYIKQADIYVQPSYYEGKSIAIDEAKILCKPIVVTAFPSIHDQIRQEKTGVIIPIDAESIAFGIERLIKDEALRKQLSDNLNKEEYDLEEKELHRHYQLFEQYL